jgi:xeroderma pigmentosum group C-complementing protein
MEAEQDAEEKARLKREERVLKRWKKLIQGLKIRQRLQEQYANGGSTSAEPAHSGEQLVELVSFFFSLTPL